MPGLLSSTPADHSTTRIDWPWFTYAKFQLPSETFPLDAYKEKTPLVKKIAKIYEAPLCDNDHHELQFTGCQNAAFYSLTPAALRAIAPFPELVKYIGEVAECFGTYFFPGNNADTSRYLRRKQKEHPMPRSIRQAVNLRDLKTCLVMGTVGIDHPRIVPLLISVSSTKQFEHLFEFGKRFFAGNFKDILRSRVQSLRKDGDQAYNILSLSPDIRRLFNKGLVGFKPLYVGATRSGHSVTYNATFSFHVLGRNQINSYKRVVPDDAILSRMRLPCEESKLTKDEIDALDKCLVHDDKVIRVPCDKRGDAESMLALLAFRWTASWYWFLAGSPGSQPDESTDPDEDPDQDDTLLQDDSTWVMVSLENAIEELEEEQA